MRRYVREFLGDERGLRVGEQLGWLHGTRTSDELSALLGLANLFPVEPIRGSSRLYRRWAFESAGPGPARCASAGSRWNRPSAAGPGRQPRSVDPGRGAAEPAPPPRAARRLARAAVQSTRRPAWDVAFARSASLAAEGRAASDRVRWGTYDGRRSIGEPRAGV